MEKKKDEKEVEEKANIKISLGKKLKENPWILSTLVFGIIAVILLMGNFSVTGHVSGEKVGEDFVNFINSQGVGEIEFISFEDFSSSLYQIVVNSNGKDVPLYVTKDGKFYIPQIFPIGVKEIEPEATGPVESNIPKSEKPEVELFVMSHCPYGTQAVKGILPALNTLGDTVDFDLRFVYYAMHPGQGEVEEQLNQYCIQKEQEEKLFDYLTCFLQEGNGEVCLTEISIDKIKLADCIEVTDTEFSVLVNLEDQSSWLNGRFPLFNIDKGLNEKYGIKGSPTLVVNGVVVESGRDPASYLDAICQGFNDAPALCGTELTATAYGPGFGYETTGSGSTAQCG